MKCCRDFLKSKKPLQPKRLNLCQSQMRDPKRKEEAKNIGTWRRDWQDLSSKNTSIEWNSEMRLNRNLDKLEKGLECWGQLVRSNWITKTKKSNWLKNNLKPKCLSKTSQFQLTEPPVLLHSLQFLQCNSSIQPKINIKLKMKIISISLKDLQLLLAKKIKTFFPF